jgi:hypothetical protein
MRRSTARRRHLTLHRRQQLREADELLGEGRLASLQLRDGRDGRRAVGRRGWGCIALSAGHGRRRDGLLHRLVARGGHGLELLQERLGAAEGLGALTHLGLQLRELLTRPRSCGLGLLQLGLCALGEAALAVASYASWAGQDDHAELHGALLLLRPPLLQTHAELDGRLQPLARGGGHLAQ